MAEQNEQSPSTDLERRLFYQVCSDLAAAETLDAGLELVFTLAIGHSRRGPIAPSVRKPHALAAIGATETTMIGALSIGKKAVTFGYKRYGVPGAIASGGVTLIGYVAVRRALQSLSESDDDAIGSAIGEAADDLTDDAGGDELDRKEG